MFGGKFTIPGVLLMLAGGGCYTGADYFDVTDEIEDMRSVHSNSIKWNDIKWNDIKWNDIKWNGVKWNGIKWNDIKWNDIKWNSSRLEDGSIHISRWKNFKYEDRSGEELVGMEINVTVDVIDEEGTKSTADFVIRVNDIYRDDSYDDIHYYELAMSLKGSNQWQPLCVDANNQPLPAIPVSGYWDETTGKKIVDKDVVTLACTNGVIAHCVQWGYRPWAKAKRCDKWDKDKKHKNDCEWISLENHHQACTRMARADYCGTGEPWTVPGTPIDIYDHLFTQIEAPETDWPVEAEWGTNGAYCLDDIRQQGWKAQGLYPQCNNGKAIKVGNCGSLKDHRALLVSKFEDSVDND